MLETPILNVLKTLQAHGETYIVGGYLRDKLLAIKPKDVDLITKIPFEDLKKIVPSIHATEQGEKIGVGRFQRNNFTFEITSISHTLEQELAIKDFTINALAHDGEKLYDFHQSQEDIEKRVIKPLDNFLSHTIAHPQAYLRAIRIATKINGHLDESLIETMKENQSIFYKNNENRIRQEGYEIVHSAHPQLGFAILHQLGFLDNATSLESTPLSFEIRDTAYTLAFLCLHSNEKTVQDFCELFSLKQAYLDEMKEVLQLDKLKLDSLSPLQLSRLIKWKRYKHQLEPKKLETFFNKIKKHLS